MDKRTLIAFKSLIVVLLFHSTLSAPVNSSISYDNFLKNITRDNCAFPKGIVLPFPDSTVTFDYFSKILTICKAPEAMKRSLEAVTLCNEIYDALRNITCHPDNNIELPEIKIDFSDDVCKDINALQLEHSLQEKGLLQHLTDKLICAMMCEDDFLPACKVLLWSFQLLKRIEGIPLVQPIQNSPNPEDKMKDSGSSSVPKSSSPNQLNSEIDKEQNSMKPNEVPAEENPDSKLNEDEQLVNDDTDKNKLEQTVNINKDKQAIDGENEIPEEPKVSGKKSTESNNKAEPTLKLDEENKLNEEKGQTEKLGEQKQPEQKENKATETKEVKMEKQTPVANNQHINDNKIDVDEGAVKSSESLLPKVIIYKNNPAIPISDVNNETELKKDITTAQNNLLPVTPKESQMKVKPVDTIKNNFTSNNLQPVVPVLNNELNKLQEAVSQSSIPHKASSDGDNEANVEIEPESSLAKENDVVDNKAIPSIGKEDGLPVTTVADLEKMEDGNGIPEPANKEADLYNDMENEGEYSKLDYDEDGFYESTKNKKPEEPDTGKISKPVLAENEGPKYDEFPQRNSFNRESGDILSTFPQQEDSHFFFYFISLILILMAGYLLFHNKQKIIALIVEGRHERRRRSHGLGYKKLETK